MIKAIIPVAGVGTRLRPHTHTQPKPLIPVAGMPILGHIIESVLQTGIKDFVFVIGHLGEKIETFLEETYADKISYETVVQSPRHGLGHAMHLARQSFQNADELLIVLGDTILDLDLNEILAVEESAVGVQQVDDPRNFGVAMVDEDDFVINAVEKPSIPKSNLALVGLYRIKEIPDLMDSLNRLMDEPPSETGEYHLTTALSYMVKEGVKLKAFPVKNWFDCGKKETLLDTNRILLERLGDQPQDTFHNTVIIPPVHIAPGAKIRDSILGPYVSIDENATISNSIVRNTIMGAYSDLDSIILDNSVIGTDAKLHGKPYSVSIGDNNQIDFNE